jgi:hypothetical protein
MSNASKDFVYAGGGIWKARRDLVYYVGSSKNIKIDIPKGTPTDFATIPWPASLIFPRDANYAIPAAIHDKLYKTHEFSKIASDAIFYQAMKDVGVDPFVRSLFYIAVVLFGGFRWKRCRG